MFKIYKNYGVLGAEKRNIYTYGIEHPLSDCSEEIAVQLPENDFFKLAENSNGDIFVKSAWGWDYEISEVLRGNEKPCFYALDKDMSGHRVYLVTE